jgi:c(7)-type cytochrome triheme protein
MSWAQSGWAPLRSDGLHDPRSPAVRDKMLQEPADALSKLTPDYAGNNVLWMRALEKGEINPRASLNPKTEVRVLDQDILLNLNGGMPVVRFPHKQHTLWLDCANCHEHLFKSKVGENKFSMLEILDGKQCGVCHGAVSFPLTECFRCHSVVRPGQLRPPNPRALLPGAR